MKYYVLGISKVKCETTNTTIKIKVTFFTMNFQN